MMLPRGSVVWLNPDPAESFVGNEQKPERPCVVVSDPAVENDLRYASMITIVPLTSTGEAPNKFYPVVRRRPRGLSENGYAMPEMLRCADKRRVRRRVPLGLTPAELRALDASLRLWLKLPTS